MQPSPSESEDDVIGQVSRTVYPSTAAEPHRLEAFSPYWKYANCT